MCDCCSLRSLRPVWLPAGGVEPSLSRRGAGFRWSLLEAPLQRAGSPFTGGLGAPSPLCSGPDPLKYTPCKTKVFFYSLVGYPAGFQTAGPSHIRRTYYFWIANREDEPVRAWEGLTRPGRRQGFEKDSWKAAAWSAKFWQSRGPQWFLHISLPILPSPWRVQTLSHSLQLIKRCTQAGEQWREWKPSERMLH